MIKILTIDEMLAMPEGTHAVVVNNDTLLSNDRFLQAGHPLKRAWKVMDDCGSVAFTYEGHAHDYFEAGEVGIEVTTLAMHTHTGPPVEVGNPKVGAASKKYSLRYLPLAANIEVNRALENGADKYGLCNWRDTNVKASVYIDAALRHIAQWQEGQEDASDSTVHNLGHAMASLAIIIDAQAQGVLIDDRPTASKDTDGLLLRNA